MIKNEGNISATDFEEGSLSFTLTYFIGLFFICFRVNNPFFQLKNMHCLCTLKLHNIYEKPVMCYYILLYYY